MWALPYPAPEGASHPECLSVKVACVKIISPKKATCLRKRNRRVLPHWLLQSFPDCSDKTQREPQRKRQLRPGKVGRRGWGRQSRTFRAQTVLGAGGAESHSQLASPQPHHTPQKRPALQPPACALALAGPPQPTPRSSLVVPESDVAGWSGVQKKRRADVRPPSSQSHPKGESRKNDRETRREWRREVNCNGAGLLGATFPNRSGSSEIPILKRMLARRPRLDSKKGVSLPAGLRLPPLCAEITRR